MRGYLNSFSSSLEASGPAITVADRDGVQLNSLMLNIAELEAIVEKQIDDLLRSVNSRCERGSRGTVH